MTKMEFKKIDSDILVLDEENIRFFHLKDFSPEEALLMVEKTSMQTLVNSIVEKGFDEVFYLHVNENNIVKDGNRRLLAYRIATGYDEYSKIVEKYEIKKFGAIKDKKAKLLVLVYKDEKSLERFVTSQHLVNEKSEWTSSAKYTYLYKLYTEKAQFNFPKNITTIAKSVRLFLDAIKFAVTDEQTERFRKAYESKVSTLYRVFGNIELNHSNKLESLLNLMKFNFENRMFLTYDSNITEQNYKEILLEITDYVVENPVGAKKTKLANFSKSFKILSSIFELSDGEKNSMLLSEPHLVSKESIEVFDSSKNNVLNDTNVKAYSNKTSYEKKELVKLVNHDFSVIKNLFITFEKIERNENCAFINGWWQRILIENSVWFIIAKAIKISENQKSYDFIYNTKIDIKELKNDKYKELYNHLINYDKIIEKYYLSNVIKKLKGAFSYSDVVSNGKPLFSRREQEILKWLANDISSYIDNLNYAAHGRWAFYEVELVKGNPKFEILKMLIKDWKKELLNELNKNE